jgi:hypothetical protein
VLVEFTRRGPWETKDERPIYKDFDQIYINPHHVVHVEWHGNEADETVRIYLSDGRKMSVRGTLFDVASLLGTIRYRGEV